MAFATADDVATRMMRALSDQESAAADLVIELITGQIAGYIGEDAAWADGLDPVPSQLKALCIEKAVGVLVNPQNVAHVTESIGSYSWGQTFPRSADLGIFLSDDEKRTVRQAVYGGGARVVTLETPYSGVATSELDFWPL